MIMNKICEHPISNTQFPISNFRNQLKRGNFEIASSILLAFAVLFASGNSSSAAEKVFKQDPQYQKSFDDSVDRALAYLAKSQLPDGSFPGGMAKNTAITSLCVMAYLARGYSPGLAPYGETIDRGIDFVLASQSPDGSLIGHGGGQMYSHNISTLMLSEVSGMLNPERQKKVDAALGKALRIILDAQRVQKQDAHRGGWRYERNSNDSDLSHSGWALMALRSARNNGAPVPKEAIEDAVRFIMKCRAQDGGFAYQPGGGATIAQTGVALLCLELCSRHREDATIKAGEYISSKYDVNKTHEIPFFYYAHYYFAQGMFQLGDDQWEKFAPKIYGTLLKLQKEDGSWPPIGQHETQPGPCYATAMAVLALSVTYHQLPIYQR
ncbi:MAG TPA: prenyltransferase [Lentisphaeria bacterium]|nr:prenyltransferase [Lentisphaeria bacterium]